MDVEEGEIAGAPPSSQPAAASQSVVNTCKCVLRLSVLRLCKCASVVRLWPRQLELGGGGGRRKRIWITGGGGGGGVDPFFGFRLMTERPGARSLSSTVPVLLKWPDNEGCRNTDKQTCSLSQPGSVVCAVGEVDGEGTHEALASQEIADKCV